MSQAELLGLKLLEVAASPLIFDNITLIHEMKRKKYKLRIKYKFLLGDLFPSVDCWA